MRDYFSSHPKVFLSLLFLCSFLVASTAQYYQELYEGKFTIDTVIDGNMWARQAEYVITDNDKQFDYLAAYGHPGGPVIELVLVGKFLGLSYDSSLAWVLVIVPGLIIAAICLMCELIRPRSLWWLGVLPLLSFHWGYLNYATPPSRIASLLMVLVSLLTVYIIEKKGATERVQIVWAILCGVLVSTRIDIGACIAAVSGLALLGTVSLKRMGALVILAVGAFWLTDPFMWFMPLQHLQDLLFKIVYHYADFPNAVDPNSRLMILRHYFQLVAPSIIGMFLAIAAFKTPELKDVRFPVRFTIAFTVMTVALYAVFSTSHYQAERYYLPTMLFWETILMFYLFICLDRVEFSKKPRVQWWISLSTKVFITTILIGYPLFPVYTSIRDILF